MRSLIAISVLATCLVATASFGDSSDQIPVEAFFSYSKVSSAKISPDGKYLAMAVASDDTGEDRQFLAIIGTDDRKIKSGFKVADGHEIWQFWWANAGRLLIATATQTGALSAATPDGSLYGINVDKTEPLQLLGRKSVIEIEKPQNQPRTVDTQANFTHITHSQPKKKELIPTKPFYFERMLFIPRDNADHVLVEGWAEDGTRMQVLNVDVQSGDVQVVVTSPTDGGRFLTDKDGQVRLAWGVKSANGDPQLFYRDSDKSASWKDLSGLYKGIDQAGDDVGPLGITQDGKAFYWNGRTQDGTMGVFRVNPQDLSQETLFADPSFDTETFVYGDFSDNEHNILAVQTYPGLPETHIVDQKDPETALLQVLNQAFPGQKVYITSSTRDGALMVVFVSSERDPGDYYLFNSKTMKADYLFSALEQIDPDKMSPMQPVSVKARDGLVLHGYLTTPAGKPAKNLPLVLLPHGGPHGIRDFWGWDPEVQFFANRGYAVLQVNFRGSGGYGMKFQDLGYRNWGTTMQDDLADSVQWAVQQGIVDPNRVCIYGASYGGYAALESVIRYPALYKCAVGYVGVYDLTLQGKYSDTERSATGRQYLDVVLGNDATALKEYSPVNHADKINVPVFIAYGGKDQRVVPDNAKELMAAMDAAGKKYEVLFDPYEDHGFKKPQNKFQLYTQMIQFLDKNIGPDSHIAKPADAAASGTAHQY